MTDTILHISDSLLTSGRAEEADTNLGGLDHAVDRALALQADAVVHTGNLFKRPEPAPSLIKAVETCLSRLNDANIPVLLIEGRRESSGDATATLVASGVASKLSNEPTIIGDVALYGIDYTGPDADLTPTLEELPRSDAFTQNLLCVHERVWPPVRESAADETAYDVMESTDVHLSGVLAGGMNTAQVWESDDFDYTVSYPGSTNPAQFETGRSPRGRVIRVENETCQLEETRLRTLDVEQELTELMEILEFRPADVSNTDTKTLVDLYGLTSRAKSVFEERRSELRDELLDRVSEDGLISGNIAEVSRRTRQRRSIKDTATVLDAADSAGIDSEKITAVDVSSVRELVDEGELPGEVVLDTDSQPSIRLKHLDNVDET